MFSPLIFALLLFLNSIKPTHAGVLFSDSFESFSNWEIVRNATHYDPHSPCLAPSGKPEWKIVDNALEIAINGSLPCSTEVLPHKTAGENLRSYRVSTRMFFSDPYMDRNLVLRWQDDKNHILFHFFGSSISVGKIVKGKSVTLENFSRGFAFQANRWYDMRMEYDLSVRTIRLYINDSIIIDAREPPHTLQLEWGKPGLGASVGAVRYSFVRFDDFRVDSMESQVRLNFPQFKQTDSRWKDQEYDSAQEWAPKKPTIGRWGCALTSGVAVLHYFGITQLDNGEELNPQTLNQWLLHQSDGYFPGGNLNWRALSRLSLWHERQFGTPALEMSYENPSDKIGWLRKKIQQEKTPVILAEPGHFIAAYGTGPGSGDIAILDPFYDRTLLSEYKNIFESARLFTPSHTDLSGITVLVPYWATVDFFSASGEKLPAQRITEFPLKDPLGTEARGQPYALYDLAKPSGPVVVRTASPITIIPLWISAYNKEGRSQIFSKTINSSMFATTIDTAADVPVITPVQTSTSFQFSTLAQLHTAEALKHPSLIFLLLEHQQKLSNATSLEEAQREKEALTITLQSAMKNNWLDIFIGHGLLSQFDGQILEKFP